MIVTINQDGDTPTRHEPCAIGTLTYLYDRSRDSRAGGAPGQDFIAFDGGEDWLAFALCDGVSQSFYGDIAARYLGEHLVAWLAADHNPEFFSAALNAALATWTPDASALVAAKPIPESLPPMVRDALERKRTNGSEAMFVCGRVDHRLGLLFLGWMGDMRLTLWDEQQQPIDLPDPVWETRERWSTRLGAKNGTAHSAVLPLSGIGRILAYSDGVGSDAQTLHHLPVDEWNDLAAHRRTLPTSDDLSIFALTFTPLTLSDPLPAPILSQPEPDEPALRWTAIPAAGWYRLAFERDGRRLRTLDTSAAQATSAILPTELLVEGAIICRVQALAMGHAAGLWSDPIPVYRSEQMLMSSPPSPTPPPSRPTLVVSGYRPLTSGDFQTSAISLVAALLAVALAVGYIALTTR
ncbi:MAG TPA: protein phosphatase 2C domain-containing protein [Aggregatilineales bacterium]|nr:protein phosphatase 2C domain-containing protein [Anaerolineales bacterium]HRE49384.1 protein phosphatase 2C domain-containing protein [Aggregatilineales bacterium]